MKWLFIIIVIGILITPLISGINYLWKNELKIFRHPSQEDIREEELLGPIETGNFRVAQIQMVLKNLGYKGGVIDGKLGKNTRRAIKEFQIANRISPTGIIDSRTYFVLLENPRIETKETKDKVLIKRQENKLGLKSIVQYDIAAKNKQREGTQKIIGQIEPKKIENKCYRVRTDNKSKTDIKSIQLVLKKLGFYNGKVDGLIGKRMRMAIRKFQKAHSLIPDGILGYKTRLCLNTEVRI